MFSLYYLRKILIRINTIFASSYVKSFGLDISFFNSFSFLLIYYTPLFYFLQLFFSCKLSCLIFVLLHLLSLLFWFFFFGKLLRINLYFYVLLSCSLKFTLLKHIVFLITIVFYLLYKNSSYHFSDITNFLTI